ncbi:MAG TPA: helix-turn-helix domain-containing protein [Pirellulaceae bacterium]|nr:helix-turn-helix domain-containing protein [Pirellulaceae bacterium]HMO92752.1 helix-turn-helix domain-containing protein [Pirellulaceae bacterium]HMP71493.1 helix-turn-helix domain-containing protein [Pirellulaceae bacterium]
MKIKYGDCEMQTANTACLLRPREAAEWLKISERSLWSLTQSNEIPSVRIGRSVRYELADLIAFVESRKNGMGQ